MQDAAKKAILDDFVSKGAVITTVKDTKDVQELTEAFKGKQLAILPPFCNSPKFLLFDLNICSHSCTWHPS